jgi:hypothetical protein
MAVRITALKSRIHKPSALVSFGLPDHLSFHVRTHAMVARRSGTNLDRESVRVRLQKWPDPPSPENTMRAKTTPQKGKRRISNASPVPAYAASIVSAAKQNLINMVAVTAVSGAVLLGLLTARHF